MKPTSDQIAEWVENNFDYKTRRGGNEYLINSPFDDDTGYNFNISLEKAACHDWRGDDWADGNSKTFIRFVQIYRRCSYVEAVQEVCGKGLTADAIYRKISKERRKKDIKEGEDKAAREYDIKLPNGSLLIHNDDSKLANMARIWLNNRGITDEMIEMYNIHYNINDVIWPYYEFGSLVYWQQRNCFNKSFLFPADSNKSEYLYGFDYAEPGEYIMISEAIFCAMSLGNQCLASGGSVISKNQLAKIKFLNPKKGVILVPDNDDAGMNSISNNYKLISPYYKVWYCLPPKIKMKNGEYSKDWNDLLTNRIYNSSKLIKYINDNVKLVNSSELLKFV